MVELPPATDRHLTLRSVTATTRTMQVGQHVMAMLLSAIGVIRVITDGIAPLPNQPLREGQ